MRVTHGKLRLQRKFQLHSRFARNGNSLPTPRELASSITTGDAAMPRGASTMRAGELTTGLGAFPGLRSLGRISHPTNSEY